MGIKAWGSIISNESPFDCPRTVFTMVFLTRFALVSFLQPFPILKVVLFHSTLFLDLLVLCNDVLLKLIMAFEVPVVSLC